MPNINKVVYGNTTLIDLTDTTAEAADVAQGKYFYTAGGVKTIGAAAPIAPTLQSKTATPTESQQTISPDSGYDGLSSVTVGAISSTYVGTGITRRSSTDLIASGATVSVPAGYYETVVSKAVTSGSASTPATTITANPSISVNSSGLITVTASASQSITPTVSAGYVSSGTAGTVTVSGSNTASLSTQAAQTIHPSTSDQTIASGKYLTGAQTVKAVTMTNLTAANIKKDVVVKIGDSTDDDCVTSVTGTYEGGGGVSFEDLAAKNFSGSIAITGNKIKGGGFSFSGITSFSAPNVTSMSGANNSYAFYACQSLTSINFPNLTTTVNASEFCADCKSLTSINFPKLKTAGSTMFRICIELLTAVLPSLQNTSNNMFQNCSKLKIVDIGAAARGYNSKLYDRWVNGVTTLETLILRTDTLVELGSTNAYDITSRMRSGGAGVTIYIPQSLYNHLGDNSSLDYKAATNWSTVNEWGTITWAKIEGSIYENAYADGTTIPTS